MTVDEAMAELQALGDPKVRARNVRSGAPEDPLREMVSRQG